MVTWSRQRREQLGGSAHRRAVHRGRLVREVVALDRRAQSGRDAHERAEDAHLPGEAVRRQLGRQSSGARQQARREMAVGRGPSGRGPRRVAHKAQPVAAAAVGERRARAECVARAREDTSLEARVRAEPVERVHRVEPAEAACSNGVSLRISSCARGAGHACCGFGSRGRQLVAAIEPPA